MHRTWTCAAHRGRPRPLGLACALALVVVGSLGLSAQSTGTVIRGAQVADGTGAPLRRADVRIVGDTITDVGTVTPRSDDTVINADGLIVAPGFVDIHNHSTEGLEREPAGTTQVAQGITTLAVGQDGSSPWPLAAYLDRLRKVPPAVNVVVLAGHATLREAVMGDGYRRESTGPEQVRMASMMTQAMAEGAFGLSSGLEYEVGSYASPEEVVALAREAGARGGFYISHIRDEADKSMEAIREAIAIGERARLPVHITHIKLGTVAVWGKAREAVAIIEAARARGVDVTADAYPYLAWQSTPRVLIPSKQYEDESAIRRGLDDIGGARNVQITRWPSQAQYVGQRLDAMARAEGISDIEAYRRFARESGTGMIGHAMIEDDLRVFYAQPWVMVASDGGIANNHPRGAGTFPRVLGRYVREQAWMTWPEAIRKMTAMPAARLGLRDRGRVATGLRADLVLLDPARIIDRATFENPRALPEGVRGVWVNGARVWDGAAVAATRPGRVLVPSPRTRP